MREALPFAAEDVRETAADLIATTMTQGGKRFSAAPRTQAEVERYASAMADMFCAYLDSLAGPPGAIRPRRAHSASVGTPSPA